MKMHQNLNTLKLLLNYKGWYEDCLMALKDQNHFCTECPKCGLRRGKEGFPYIYDIGKSV